MRAIKKRISPAEKRALKRIRCTSPGPVPSQFVRRVEALVYKCACVEVCVVSTFRSNECYTGQLQDSGRAKDGHRGRSQGEATARWQASTDGAMPCRMPPSKSSCSAPSVLPAFSCFQVVEITVVVAALVIRPPVAATCMWAHDVLNQSFVVERNLRVRNCLIQKAYRELAMK